jgi:hypothetical protein
MASTLFSIRGLGPSLQPIYPALLWLHADISPVGSTGA